MRTAYILALIAVSQIAWTLADDDESVVKAAKFGQFPSVVLIRRRCFGIYLTEITACTGILIKADTVLTSRKCIEANQFLNWKIFYVQAGIVVDNPAYGFYSNPIGPIREVMEIEFIEKLAVLKLVGNFQVREGATVNTIRVATKNVLTNQTDLMLPDILNMDQLPTDTKGNTPVTKVKEINYFTVGWVEPLCGFACLFGKTKLKYSQPKKATCVISYGVDDDKSFCYKNTVYAAGGCQKLSEGPLLRETIATYGQAPKEKTIKAMELVGFFNGLSSFGCKGGNVKFANLVKGSDSVVAKYVHELILKEKK